MNIYVLRHGQTDFNVQNIMLGESDVPLNRTGKKQAVNIREEILKLDIDIVFCSPMKRTKSTCKIINNINSPVIYDERLKERKCGKIEGLRENEFDYSDFWDYNKKIEYNNAESIQELFNRVNDFLQDIIKKYNDKNVLIVTHNGVCRAINCFFKGVPKDGKLIRLRQKNCEIKRYIIC